MSTVYIYYRSWTWMQRLKSIQSWLMLFRSWTLWTIWGKVWNGCRMYGISKVRNRQLCSLIKRWHHFCVPFWLLLSRLVNQLKIMHIIDPLFIYLILVHLENVSLQCKDSDAVEGTMECLEPDSICLVKRVGMCMLPLSWKTYWMLKVDSETTI